MVQRSTRADQYQYRCEAADCQCRATLEKAFHGTPPFELFELKDTTCLDHSGYILSLFFVSDNGIFIRKSMINYLFFS